QSLNRYAYVLNNPLRFVDPSGHVPIIDAGDGVGSFTSPPETPVSGDVVANWLIYDEMLPNAQSPIALTIERLNAMAVRLLRDEAQKVLRNGPEKSDSLILILAAYAKVEAYRQWKSMVQTGAPWDHKPYILSRFGAIAWHDGYGYRFDIWSNIHYGYVGRKVGLSRTELLAGAGAAQIMDGTSQLGYWGSWFDDPYDQASIRIGIELYERYQLNVTPAQFWQVFDDYAGLLPRRGMEPRFGTGSAGGNGGYR
ncbi:MAG: hypothetical protein D6694_15780, partial [Gammaproteobacteria bacterium]